jgi:hypothetical protein
VSEHENLVGWPVTGARVTCPRCGETIQAEDGATLADLVGVAEAHVCGPGPVAHVPWRLSAQPDGRPTASTASTWPAGSRSSDDEPWSADDDGGQCPRSAEAAGRAAGATAEAAQAAAAAMRAHRVDHGGDSLLENAWVALAAALPLIRAGKRRRGDGS